MAIGKRDDASKERRGRDQALALARAASKVVVAKGKKVATLDMKDEPDEETLLSHLLGPTGNLRAPTMRIGSTLLVGFSPELYEQVFGRSPTGN